jgi:prepilin-type N-terminal cleavage/methylation domain-containing protein
MRPTPAKQPRGFTLIELMVSMVVLTILGAAIAAIMVAQLKSATSIQGQSMVQSDVNLALSMIRADLNQAGYGNATGDSAAAASGAGAGDNLTLLGANVGGGEGRWTIVDSGNTSSASHSTLRVRHWTGSYAAYNIVTNDSVKIITGVKELIGKTKVTGISSPDSVLDELTISPDQTVGTGAVVCQFSPGARVAYTLDAANRRLLRNGAVFLDNVENFQVRYFWDRNGDGTIDSLGGETDDVMNVFVNPATWNNRPMLVGISFVTSSPAQENKVVDPRANYTVWNNTFTITPPQNRRYRNFYSLYVRPRNIGG